MPRGYRLLIIASGGIAALTALGTGAYFGALYATNNSQQAAKRADSASNAKQHYPNQIDRDRAGLPNIVERIASAPDPQSTDEKEKRDLAAQEASALWSFWMLVATGFSAIITMIGTGFLLWQIMLTREAVEDTGRATDAMRDANQIASEASVRQLRPYLHISNASFNIQMSKQQSVDSMHNPNIVPDVSLFTVFFKNHGQTTAIAVELWIKCTIEEKRNGIKNFAPDSETVWGNMPPNMEHSQKVAFEDTGRFYKSIFEGAHMVLLDGRLEYKDFFGNSYRTDFRYYSTKTHFTGNTYQIAFHGNEAT